MSTKSTEPCQEIASFLKTSSILKVLDEQILWGVSMLMEEISFGQGDIVFKEGAESDALYIVREGAVEVRKGKEGASARPVAYLTAGECFGEIGVVQGTARGATVVVPEKARVLKLGKKSFDELRRKFPKITTEIAGLINKRTAVDFQPAGLSGNLAVFDLATVIQTIAGSKQSGLLSLTRHGISVAALQFEAGKLTNARFENLRGELAFYALLQKKEPLSFEFEVGAKHDTKDEETQLIERPIDMLLIEGMRRADEIARIAPKLKKLGSVVVRCCEEAEQPEVPGVSNTTFQRLWGLLDKPIEVTRLQSLCTTDEYSIQRLLAALYETDKIKASELPSEEQVLSTAQLLLSDEELKMLEEARKAPLELTTPESIIETGSFASPASAVASLIFALNSTANGLSIIVDKRTVRSCLGVAIEQAKEQFPQLSELKMHEETATIDLREATSLLLDEKNATAVKTLAYLFLGLVVYSDWFTNPVQGSLSSKDS
jgi:CRP-like cAMP-binding protein